MAAGLALARVGCRVTIFERAEALTEAGAGVQLSPNACAVLDRLGLLEALAPVAVEPAEVLIRRGRDGAPLARVPLGAAARSRYGYPSLVVTRADLQRVLLAAVRRERGIAINLGHGVLGFEPAGSGVSLRLEGTSEASQRVDALVAADGIRSALRPRITGVSTDALRPAGRTAWRTLVPSHDAEADACVARSNLWLGRRAHLVHYPVDGGRQVNVVAILDHGSRTSADDLWSAPGDPAVLRRRFAEWAEPARRLVATALSWRCWALHDRAPLARWSSGPATLLGDAAHPMLPFLAQGAAQALEDAAALAAAIAASPGDVPAAFLRYETRRRPRTAQVQAASAGQARIYHLGPPLSFARDLALRSLGPERLAARYDWLYGAV